MFTRKEKQLGEEYRNVSLSHGTMNADHLFEAIREFLPDKLRQAFTAASDGIAKHDLLAYEIWDHMNEIAPEGCVFGAHEGDGSEFGFWEIDGDGMLIYDRRQS